MVKENRLESVAPNEPFFLSRAHFTPQDPRWAGLAVSAGQGASEGPAHHSHNQDAFAGVFNVNFND